MNVTIITSYSDVKTSLASTKGKKIQLHDCYRNWYIKIY